MRGLRRGFWKLLAIVIIGSAAVVSIGRLLAPHADVARPAVQELLSTALDQPVRIREIRASWPRMSPEIRLHGLQIGPEDDPLLQIDLARLQLRLYNLVRPARNTVGLTALGLDVAVTQDEAGRWSWQLEQGGRIGSDWERALTAGDLTLRNVGIRIEPLDLPGLQWEVPEAALARDGDQVAVRLLARPDGLSGEPVEIGMRLALDDSRGLRLRGHAEIERLVLPLDQSGDASVQARGEAWVTWDQARGLIGRADLTLQRLLDRDLVETAELRVAARGADDQLRMGFDAFDPSNDERATGEPSAWLSGAVVGRSANHWGLGADRVDLNRLQDWLAPLRDRWSGIPRSMDGTVTDLELAGDRGGHLHAAAGRIESLRLVLASPSLELTATAAELSLRDDALGLAIDGELGLDWPELLPEPVDFDVGGGTVALRPTWIEVIGLQLEHPEAELRIDGHVQRLDDAPFIDLVVETPRVSTENPQRWLPLRGLPPKARGWLDRALVRVGRVEATTTLFGEPLSWRRRLPDGGLNSRIIVEGLDLDYAPGWPRAEQIRGRLEILGESLRASAQGGVVAGAALTAPRFEVDRLREAVIELDLASAESTGTSELATLVRALPLRAARPALDRMRWSGPARATAELQLPVKRIREWTIDGRVQFDEASLRWPLPDYRLDAIRGEVRFDREGFGPSRLDASRNGETIEVVVESSFRPRFQMALAGRWPLSAALPDDVGGALEPLVESADGAAEVQVMVLGPTDGAPAEVRVTSDLRGLALDWPAPMDKPVEAAWPFQLDVPLDDSPLRFELLDRVEGLVIRPGEPPDEGGHESFRVGLGLGGTRARLPATGQFEVNGALRALDVSGWVGRLAAIGRAFGGVDGGLVRGLESDLGERLQGSIDVQVEDLRFDRSSLGAVDVQLDHDRDFWRLVLDGPSLAGRARLPAGGSGVPTVVVELARLYWPRELSSDEPPGPPSRLDPRGMPEIDLRVDDLRYGDLELGELSVNTHAAGRGLEIEQLSIEHPSIALTGSGRWQQPESEGAPETRGRFRLTADSLGQVLADAGFDLALQRGRAVITLQGGWPGSPLDFTLQRFEGGLELAIGDGVIPEARVGAGRLLGLVSLNSIPRRLRMDFTDVFAEGLTFDRVAGHFDMAAGRATTDDLVIEAPAAIVQVRGETDLVERTYDQSLIVQPGVGATLPIIGALAGGPIGAAAGAALQQLLDKPLRGVSEVQYSVVGPWDAPDIVPVSARGVEDGQDAAGPPPGGS